MTSAILFHLSSLVCMIIRKRYDMTKKERLTKKHVSFCVDFIISNAEPSPIVRAIRPVNVFGTSLPKFNINECCLYMLLAPSVYTQVKWNKRFEMHLLHVVQFRLGMRVRNDNKKMFCILQISVSLGENVQINHYIWQLLLRKINELDSFTYVFTV